MHTHVGRYCISSVGDYWTSGAREPMGGEGEGEWYETMVFDLQSESRWVEIDCDRYATEADADAGHMRMVARYTRVVRSSARKPCNLSGGGME